MRFTPYRESCWSSSLTTIQLRARSVCGGTKKGCPPGPKLRPEPRRDGTRHFDDPANAIKEAELEARLEREFEDPVNEFIGMIGFRTFFFTPANIRALTGYVTMLFTRSRARRGASQEHAEILLSRHCGRF